MIKGLGEGLSPPPSLPGNFAYGDISHIVVVQRIMNKCTNQLHTTTLTITNIRPILNCRVYESAEECADSSRRARSNVRQTRHLSVIRLGH